MSKGKEYVSDGICKENAPPGCISTDLRDVEDIVPPQPPEKKRKASGEASMKRKLKLFSNKKSVASSGDLHSKLLVLCGTDLHTDEFISPANKCLNDLTNSVDLSLSTYKFPVPSTAVLSEPSNELYLVGSGMCEKELHTVPVYENNIQNLISDGNRKLLTDSSVKYKTIQNNGSLQENETDILDLLMDDWVFDEVPTLQQPDKLDLSKWQRCVVISVAKSTNGYDKMLQLRSLASEAVAACTLQGVWASSRICTGSIISIKAERSPGNESFWTVNNETGFFVEFPDVLLSPTVIVGSLSCLRQGVINYLFCKPDLDEGSKILVTGSLIHELLQQILTQGTYEPECIAAVVEDVISTPRNVRLLYSCNMSLKEARSELLNIVPNIQRFCNTYVLDETSLHRSSKNGVTDQWNGRIQRVLATEDNFWVPQLGLKGKIDITVIAEDNGRRDMLMPVELKTGNVKNSPEHRGQVILYCMMVSEISQCVPGGLLLYLRDGTIQKINAGRHEQRDIMLLRNRFARYITPQTHADAAPFDGLSLPEPVTNKRICQWCPHITTCSTFLRLPESEENESKSEANELRMESVKHLSLQHMDYFMHWSRLLWMEEADPNSGTSLRNMWCVPPEKREENGKCVGNLTVEKPVTYKGPDSYLHVFKYKNSSSTTIEAKSLFASGDTILLSTNIRIAVTFGSVVDVTKNSITVDLPRDVTQDINGDVYCIDLYEPQSQLKWILGNLAALLDNNSNSARLRRLLIERKLPTFTSVPEMPLSSMAHLNVSQKQAVLKALAAQDYLLIKGLPGTGKSTTVAIIIELLVAQGCSVLLTANTHSAVDTVLLKLVVRGVPFLRLGSPSRVHEAIRSWTENCQTNQCFTPELLEAVYNAKPVVATTCLGVNHALFTRRSFDVCIVDESTQTLQPVVLGTLLRANRFILVGDPEQLPPVVRSRQAREMGLSKCLFTHLDRPEATVCLDLQYRMNSHITRVANALTYGGKLKCASLSVSEGVLQIQKEKMAECKTGWMCRALSSKEDDAVVFINVNTFQEHKASNYINKDEASIIEKLLLAFIKAGIDCINIGVIAPYRAQVSFLQSLARGPLSGVEMKTVDQYQGREKDIIIFSCTNNWSSGVSSSSDSGILSDQRRLTVAITRARYKLILIGCLKSLKTFSPFECIFKTLGESNIIETV